MREQARDKKGLFLYRLTIEQERGVYRVEFVKRKNPIKRLSNVLRNELNKRQLLPDYLSDTGIISASLQPYEKWDYERNNPL